MEDNENFFEKLDEVIKKKKEEIEGLINLMGSIGHFSDTNSEKSEADNNDYLQNKAEEQDKPGEENKKLDIEEEKPGE